MPAAWIGGSLHIPKQYFLGLLAASLLVAGLTLLWEPMWKRDITPEAGPRWIEPVAGGLLGLLAGIVGIGGGIFLAPLLYLLRWDAPKRIAATCAAFILVNSLAGLAGQASKGLASASVSTGPALARAVATRCRASPAGDQTSWTFKNFSRCSR